jgi:serine/threonine-protein kinase
MNESIPQSVENIILKACAKNPKNRYNTVKDMYADIETCLDEERQNEKRYVYPYSETEEIEDTKEVKTIKEVEKQETTELDEIEENEEKNSNKLIISLGIMIAVVMLGIIIALIVFMKKPKVKEIEVPDVSNLNVAQAEARLKDSGFTINEEQEEQPSDTIEEGYVIKTNPQSGVKRKKGTPITLVVSTGVGGITLENYVGSNFYEIKGKLEAFGLVVNQETKDVEKNEEAKENQILEQRPIAGTKLVEGDTVTLIIPNLIVNYPNFVEEEGWSKDAIERFCEANKISVTFVEQETDTYPEGTIIKQDHVAGTRVKEGYPLTITIAKAKKVEKPKPQEPENENPETQETETSDQGN